MDNTSEKGFIEMLGQPEIGLVQRSDGKALEPGVPEYIVRPALYRTHSWRTSNQIKIIDFGESFLHSTVPQTLHTPLPVRAPEVIFGDRLDYRVDLWSMGCMVGRITKSGKFRFHLNEINRRDSFLRFLSVNRPSTASLQRP